MKFLINSAKTVRTHWKKSTAFTCLCIYGAKYCKDLYDDDLLRRQYCEEARVYGDQVCGFGEKNRKITVFLNPAANGGRSKKLFEKNAAPVLYVAGIEVNVVKTEYDGQVKEFFKYLQSEHMDGVVVAGGNGTLLEAVTGMMRKEDKAFCRKVPVGVIPVGQTNRFATFFYGPDKSDVRRMLDAAMAVVKNNTEKLDVLKIEGEGGKTTYALCGLEAGGYRDAKERTFKYWYYGPLKHRFTYLWTTVRKWPATISGTAEYVEARDTDVPVTKTDADKLQQQQLQQQQKGWISIFFGLFASRKPFKQVPLDEDDEDIEYENLHTEQRDLSTVELVLTSNFDREKTDKNLQGVRVSLGPDNITKGDFITEGWKRLARPDWKIGSENDQQLICRKFKFTPNLQEGEERWYSIDGEQYEAIPLEATLLRNRLKIYKCPDKLPT